jgi:hypothetical protein
MDAKYIVFCDNAKGMTWMPQMGADTIKECIQNIKEECVGCPMPSQHWMYFIYESHSKKVPYWGTQVDVYRYVKAVAGAKVKFATTYRCHGLLWAITHQSAMNWLFTDDLWAD